jgi:hypothetical protein
MVLMPIDQRWVWGGIAVGGAGFAIYMYRRDKKLKDATKQAESYGYGYGYGYGSENPSAGFYTPYGYGYGPYGLGNYGYGSGGGQGYYGGGVPAQVPQQATTNAQWSEAAMSALTTAGFDGTAVLAALGQYLVGGNLSAEQQSIVSAAIAAEGYPPVEGPGGYPPAMHTQTATGQTGGTGGTGGGGGGGGLQYADNPPKNLHVVFMGRTGGQIQWNPVARAQRYTVYMPKQNRKFDTTNTIANLGALKPNTSYSVQVWADPTPTGGPHASLTFKTKA